MKHCILLTCLLAAISANSFTTARAQVDANDSLALMDLYNSTDGPHWKHNANWLTTMPVSTWYGVSVTDNRVVSLSLNSNALSGTIPASIGNLVQLTQLNLYENKLSGIIPPEIGNLVNLSSISISDNQLTGAIPATIGNLVKLHYLDLYSNQLTGAIPATVGNLVNLWGMYLYDNQLSGAIPATIGNITSIKELYIFKNQLSGAIPATIGNLVNLVALELNNNELSDIIPDAISSCKHLQYLYINSNQLTGSIPASLGNLKKLISLQLDHNALTGNIPTSLGGLQHLSYINLSDNQLSQNGNLQFTIGIKYVSGSISNNRFTFDGLEFIAKKFFNLMYAPQATIPVHQQGNTLSVYAGGTLSNNTYYWFKVGATDSTIIKGDSTFTPPASGKYYAKVTNKIAKQLTLYSDTIDFATGSVAADKMIAGDIHTSKSAHRLLVYPNPATSIIHIQVDGTATIVITNADGKLVLSKTINNTDAVNVNAFANGIYYVKNKTTGEAVKIVVVH